MTLGTLLGAVFQVMRRNPLPTFGLALLLYGGGGVLTIGLGVVLVGIFASSQPSAYFGGGADATLLAAVLGAVAAGLGAIAISLISTSIVQGIVVLEVSRGTLGERLRLGGLWRMLRPRLGRVIGWVALQSAALTLAATVLVVLIVVLVAAGGTAGVVIAVLLGILGFLALVVGGVWLGVKLVFTVPAIVLERRGVGSAMRRSWALTGGYFWRSLGILALVYLIYSVAGQVVAIPVSLLGSLGSVLIAGSTTDPQAMFASSLVSGGASALVGIVIGAVGLVMISATTGLLYIDTRMRKEGLDQDLARAAEERAAGRRDVDPYAPAAGTAAAGTTTPVPGPPDSPWA
ncbi:MAG: glycerophosphoryl diester phosphodiesterase membrane domain-containing protein [Micrococcales bacterium]|nr:glycerophosphoryl diester phosphodiesterase membrane domain-containing protein [Micrococcales bacterium]